MDWKGRFWAGVFSEADGTPSFSRVASGVALAFGCGWVSAIVVAAVRRGVRPELPDFIGLIAFLGVFYGINKGTALFKKTGE
jgi:hypothetical protein